jgi:hypothetical protein
MKKIKLQFILILISSLSFGQGNDNIFTRLQAISNNGVDFFNIDGIEITSQKIDALFTPKNISKKYKQLKIKENELITGDSLLGLKNYYVFKSEEEPKGFHNNISYYFIETSDQKIIAFTFASVNKTDKELERTFIRLAKDNLIPKSVYNDLQIDSIDFAGRKIPLGGSCHWMGVNNVQCNYYGQMNWSVHKDIDDAIKTVNNQFESIKARGNGKVVSDSTFNVIFEGNKTSAKRVIYDFTGVTSALVGMSGGKTLTIYFVAAPVRQNYVSCVMSFWNNDQINLSGLAPLLEQVMKLE